MIKLLDIAHVVLEEQQTNEDFKKKALTAALAAATAAVSDPLPLIILTIAPSLQARYAASLMPLHMPWPRKGGMQCAASPASSTLPRRSPCAVEEELPSWDGGGGDECNPSS